MRSMTCILQETVAQNVLQALLNLGVQEFCICPGARAVEFTALLQKLPALTVYNFYDERSAGFFALGRARRTERPVPIIVTSGTAPAHLLAPLMEAYYVQTPLVVISADRPRRFRGSNAPQSAEQVGLFGQYATMALDLAEDDSCDLSGWDRRSPLHLNICLEEPNKKVFSKEPFGIPHPTTFKQSIPLNPSHNLALNQFLESLSYPFVIVGALPTTAKEAVTQFLEQLQAPVFLEAISGLREEPRLKSLQMTRTDRLWTASYKNDYPIDGILRIGGVPTFRLWRDLEEREGKIPIFSLSENPFSGLSWGSVAPVPLDSFFQQFSLQTQFSIENAAAWLNEDARYQKELLALYAEEPYAELSLMHALSLHIPPHAFVFLGNSLPIREWDQAATFHPRHFDVRATRGLNGIDGQTSTFLGFSQRHRENWGILGDLTALHDLSAPWILKQLPHHQIQLVVINNGGGRIFARMFPHVDVQNTHETPFKPVADLWELAYERWQAIPPYKKNHKSRLIEIVPDYAATQRLWKRVGEL